MRNLTRLMTLPSGKLFTVVEGMPLLSSLETGKNIFIKLVKGSFYIKVILPISLDSSAMVLISWGRLNQIFEDRLISY